MNERKENSDFLSKQLITYIGNKRLLLPNINDRILYVKKHLNQKRLSCFDGFSGSGVVSRLFKQHASKIIVNDLEAYTNPINTCYLSNPNAIRKDAWENIAHELEQNLTPGFISELYSPANDEDIQAGERVFYTNKNALYIDGVRKNMESIDQRLVPFFLAPLLHKASVHVNTSGIFKGFHKNESGVGQFGGRGKNALGRIRGEIKLEYPIFSNFYTDEVVVLNEDANKVVENMPEVDLAYFDPPYNQHPYGSNYFMLNLITSYERPDEVSKVSGITKGWNRSDYNVREKSAKTFFNLIKKCPAKFILISFNSEGFIPFHSFNQQLKRIGKVQTFSFDYDVYKGCRNRRDRSEKLSEYLFLVEKN